MKFAHASHTAGAAFLAANAAVARTAHVGGSDLIRIALIGCGGRGTGAAAGCLRIGPNVKVVALADVFKDKAVLAAERLRSVSPSQSQVEISDDRIFDGFDAYRQAIATDAN